jgi:hypothetical protein
MDDSRDIMESAKAPKPPGPTDPYDAERRTSFLLHTIAVASVAAAFFTGITAWETHEEHRITKTVYCTSFSYNSEPDPQQEKLFDQLGC